MADLCLAPLLVAITAILFIIFLIKKKLIQNCKGHTTISASSGRRAFQFGLDNDATHQCRYNCSWNILLFLCESFHIFLAFSLLFLKLSYQLFIRKSSADHNFCYLFLVYNLVVARAFKFCFLSILNGFTVIFCSFIYIRENVKAFKTKI